ncbi:MAG: hypothetical protein NVS2B12_16040 [Ktedonobacteraceae bacterium]
MSYTTHTTSFNGEGSDYPDVFIKTDTLDNVWTHLERQLYGAEKGFRYTTRD